MINICAPIEWGYQHKMKVQRGGVSIGTSGLVLRQTKAQYPTALKDVTRLHYYSTIFNSIEINSTFYKLHKPATFAKWSNDVTEEFRFTVKLWKEISHKKGLDYEQADLLKFMSTLSIDDKRQGCMLVQFPASIDASFLPKVENLVNDVAALTVNSSWRTCVEFRHKSWYIEEIFVMLSSHNVNIVLHDMPKSKFLLAPVQNSVVYLRFHGEDGTYRGSYSSEQLDDYAQQICGWLDEGKEVFVYLIIRLETLMKTRLVLNKRSKS